MSRLAWLVLFLFSGQVLADDLTVLDAKKDAPKTMMRRYLQGLAWKAMEKRKQTYELLSTKDDIQKYQKRLKAFFLQQLGDPRKKTPLNPHIVGRLEGDGCRIEKIIFESRPNHYVTANLYLPKGKGPYPGVLVPCGHSANGKVAYQRLCIFLAQSGLAAFCYDPIGQGERYQILTKAGKPQYKSTTEHSSLGVSCILVGRNTASYRIHDGIRALDYLVSRKDIDASRLGCTGVSGGGTLTEYLMALDPRIKCAAPACAPMTFERRLKTIGPGDAEQNIFGQIAYGLDHADYTILRAPKPTLLLTATRDFVDIQGGWDLFRETKRLYTRLGHPEKVDLVEADAKHGFSLKLREGSVRWMRRWLLGKDDTVTEPEIKLCTAKDLQCTRQGQVQLIKDAKSVLDFNLEVVREFAEKRRELWKPENRAKALSEVRRLTGIRPLAKLPMPKVKKLGTIQRQGFVIEKLTLEPEEGIVLPALMLKPVRVTGKRILYVHGQGKASDMPTLETLVKAGNLVLTVDLRGIGETGAPSGMWGGNFYDIFVSYLLGKSFIGMRTEDILTAARYLSKDGKPVELIAVGLTGPPALHAAALESRLFSDVKVSESIASWIDVVRDPTMPGQLVNTVHGALRAYDLKDLAK